MGMPKGQKLDAEALKARRLEARRLLDEGVAQAEVARRLKTSRQSVSRWAQQPRRHLAQVRRQGRKAQLDEPARAKLRAAILAGPQAAGFAGELWTVPRVRQLIAQRFGTRFSTVHVWRMLGQLGFSPQRPVGRARERDEQKIAEWQTRTWPRLKKKPAGSAAPSSSSTRAD
ncbi:MAG: winged helix-turn-helix domain-containing protein [Lacunisphaera sp.]